MGEHDWLIVKRDLYFRPNCQGYTGIRDEAGRYSREIAQQHADHGECTMVRASEAPEFLPAAYNDLVIKHLSNQKASLIEALTEIEDLGANGATAARLGNIAHAALLAIRVPVGCSTQGDQRS